MSGEPELPRIPDTQGPHAESLGEWLRGEGPDVDIALCTRIRFARNVQGYRFSTSLDAREAADLDAFLRRAIASLRIEPPLTTHELTHLDALEREVLVERHLISREHAHSERPRSVAYDAGESVAMMINEEDHLRSQVFRSGLCVGETYRAAEALDDALLGAVPIAFSEQFGFLTACPTNVGTGLRASVMLHLPALVWGDEIERAAHSAQKIHLAVRGMYGEGSRALGDFYQVSNQITLGRTEAEVLEDVETAVRQLVDWERRVRIALLSGRKADQTKDRVFRALGTLQNAHILTSEECLTNLSAVRLGVHQELIQHLTVRDLNQILLLTQPAHLQQLCAERLAPADRDARRAGVVRAVLTRAASR
ncbi:MAG: protein arginine kinase [Planctomycetes bacterium]|nr:protein arginine kinase [Planctomycetota bacterium]